ncbi:hypothetical protein RclHR1_10830002 [Rhizophagus clarus]|uniref:MACPF domain-containing protein n=1 Tax=Rhizophagus clarus TaxID=94130 RepID=A0A2Z6QHD9_9GLOM|nr:hypothetical protein RclHR1_10830002 [Rhizophagus clarus]GES80279.1 hypothetical protein GLOIN_2v1882323 [Rhizophagus clarus]
MSIVLIKIIGNSPLQSSILKRLNPDDHLTDIRKELESSNIINDTLLFSKKINSNDKEENNEISEVKREDEENFYLKEILKVENDEDQKILYLKRLYWKFLSNQCKLDYGRIMSFDGIKIAEKQAYTMDDCELSEINSYKRGRLEFESKEDWMKKTNLFVDVDGINITNFAKLGLSVEGLRDKSFNKEIMSAYQYIEVGKVSLKFSKSNLRNLILTDEFKNDLIDVIQSNDPKKFEKITEVYGQFIPTEVILGGRVYFNDVRKSLRNSGNTFNGVSGNISIGTLNATIGYNSCGSEKTSEFYSFNHMGLLGGKHPDDEEFDEKAWIESLKDYQNWECIKFKNPISIFQLLSDDLPDDLKNLRKRTYKSIGKRILYTNIKECDYYLNELGRYRTFELQNIPQNILELIQNEEADCDIFASVIDTDENSKNVFFDCHILRKPKTKPSIIIHGIQKNFQKRIYNLKVKIMVIGYDIDFNFILPDTIGVELVKNICNPLNPCEFYSIPLQRELDSMLTSCLPFFGIPVLNNLDSSNKSIIIGHKFRNTQLDNVFNVDVYSYCVKKKCFDKLPRFIFCTLYISNYPASSSSYASLPFNFKLLGNPFIDLNTASINPKCVSLYLSKNNNYKPMFLKQKINQIKIKYLNCNCKKTCFICKNKPLKISKNENNIECILFDSS